MMHSAPLFVALGIMHAAQGALFSTSDFEYNVYLDEDEIFRMLWTKLNETHTEFGVICDNPGWCAIGVSPSGKMTGSDIAFFWVDDTSGDVYLQDRYAEGRSVPVLDDNDDLTFLEGSQESDITYIRFIRKNYPCDRNGQDVDVSIGTSRIVWAYNENDPTEVEFDSSSVEWHGSDGMGVKSVNLLTETSSGASIDYNNTMYADIRMPSTSVPDDSDTTYYCGLVSLPRLNTTHHIVSIDALIDEGNEAVVHHMIMYHCPATVVNESHIGLTMDCDDWAEMGIGISDCRGGTPIYSWAIGGEIFELPDHVGMEMGGDINDDSMVQYILIETHWDNPNYESGIVDSSGFRVWYTDELRNTTASGFWVGLNVNPYAHFIPLGIDSVTNEAWCDSDCLSYAMPEDGITIFASMLHAHVHGVALKASVIRNGEEIAIIDENENYDFNYQTTSYLSEPITLEAGDTIYVSCTYSTIDATETIYAGEATSEEMCLVWLSAYPAIELKNCISTWNFGGNYYDWYVDGITQGYISYSDYLWQGTSDEAIDYYENLWQNATENDISRLAICITGDSWNGTDIEPGTGYGVWDYFPPDVTQWYEYESYCNWTGSDDSDITTESPQSTYDGENPLEDASYNTHTQSVLYFWVLMGMILMLN